MLCGEQLEKSAGVACSLLLYLFLKKNIMLLSVFPVPRFSFQQEG